jgi:hypothetical protein
MPINPSIPLSAVLPKPIEDPVSRNLRGVQLSDAIDTRRQRQETFARQNEQWARDDTSRQILSDNPGVFTGELGEKEFDTVYDKLDRNDPAFAQQIYASYIANRAARADATEATRVTEEKKASDARDRVANEFLSLRDPRTGEWDQDGYADVFKRLQSNRPTAHLVADLPSRSETDSAGNITLIPVWDQGAIERVIGRTKSGREELKTDIAARTKPVEVKPGTTYTTQDQFNAAVASGEAPKGFTAPPGNSDYGVPEGYVNAFRGAKNIPPDQALTQPQIDEMNADFSGSRRTQFGYEKLRESGGLDILAWQYLQTLQFPGRQAAMNAEIAIRSAEINDERIAQGLPPINPVVNRANLQADAASIRALTGNLDAIQSFEQTAQTNLSVFRAIIQNAKDAGTAVANRPLRDIALELGSSQQAAMDTARAALYPEIARLLFNPQLSGVLSDSARVEASTLLDEGYTIEQFESVLNVLESDFAARQDAMQSQLNVAQRRIESRGQYQTTPIVTPERTIQLPDGREVTGGWDVIAPYFAQGARIVSEPSNEVVDTAQRPDTIGDVRPIEGYPDMVPPPQETYQDGPNGVDWYRTR